MLGKILLLATLALVQGRPQRFMFSTDCPDELTHHLLPHEWDCSKFYYCEYSYKRLDERSCAPGTYFSFSEQVCVLPADSDCASAGAPETEAPETEAPEAEAPETEAPDTEAPETEAPETEAPETEEPETEAPAAPEVLPNGCPANYELELLFAHESECDLFYQCTHGEKVLRQCATGTAFDFESQRCELDTEGCSNSGNGDGETDGETEPESEAPETEAPETEAPETEAPETEAPETEAPETEAPETEAPETEQPETEAPAAPEFLPNGCPGDYKWELLFPHESECNLFYQCTHGEKVLRECATGTAFDFESQKCELDTEGCSNSDSGDGETDGETEPETETPETEAPETEAPETEAPETEAPDSEAPETEEPAAPEFLPNGCPADYKSELLFPHESECNLFYQCTHGEKVLRECAAGTAFEFESQRCELDTEGCSSSGNGDGETDGETEPETEAPETEEPETEAPETEEPETETPETEEPAAPEFLPNGCPTDYKNELLFPHESECNLFYQCTHGEKIVRECAKGTAFDFESQSCEWDTEGCSNSGNGDGETEPETEEPETEAPETEAPETEEPEAEAPAAPEFLPNGCPADYKSELLFPHESECNLFYQCTHGEKVLRECAAGTAFDFESQTCELDTEGCSNSGNGNGEADGEAESETEAPETEEPETDAPETEEPETDAPETEEPETEAPETEEPAAPEFLPNGCPADYESELLFPHEGECNLFYQCTHGEKVVRECPKGTAFDYESQSCEWDTEGCSNNGNGGDETEPETEAPETAAPETEAPETEETETAAPETEAPETEAPETGAPETEGETEPETDGEIDGGECSGDDLLPHENCRKFYQCVHGTKVEMRCPSGLHFSYALQSCEWSSSAGCDAGAGETEPETDGEAEPETDGEAEPETDGEAEPETEADLCQTTCNAGPWAADSCNEYWWCNGETSTLGSCPEGLHFNAGRGTCDFIENAGCAAA